MKVARIGGARIVSKGNDYTLKVAVYIPGNCVVGEWELKVKTTLVGSKENYVMIYPKPISILFNPWSKEDQVHFTDDKKLLKEYILNEAGTVFTGNSDRVGSRKWENLGVIFDNTLSMREQVNKVCQCAYFELRRISSIRQYLTTESTKTLFEEGILQVSFTILRKAFGFKVTPAMADAVEVSRALTRAVNSSDDDGVLVGNWSRDYSGGTPPTVWTDSTAILLEYAETKQPVKYGQCWVFSHVLTAVCRALGLPCRSVTNFDSAHDTDSTCTIDRYFDDEGNKLKDMGHDSIWNFHVWNEVWLLRPDLPKGYDGWHCIDATPQEQSHAVKKGEIHIGYDTAFVFSEVNAEVVNWVADSIGLDAADWKYSSTDKEQYVQDTK
nr:hypothetical protein BaRGS_017874 [Batillaria attramentaria]